MVKLMRACQFLRGRMVMMTSRMCCLFRVRGTLVRGMVLFPRMRRRFMVRGVMTARVGRLGVMGRFRRMFR